MGAARREHALPPRLTWRHAVDHTDEHDINSEFYALWNEQAVRPADLVALTQLAECPHCPACGGPTEINGAGHVSCPACATRRW
jgi:hypothetical protein